MKTISPPIPRARLPRRYHLLPGWAVTAQGDTVYVRAQDKKGAVKVVEDHHKMPPGALQMDIQPCATLPAGEVWLNDTRPLL